MTSPALHKPVSPEEELLARARRKNQHAISQIIRRHNQKLYRLARGIVRDDSEAEDVLQEAYVRAFSTLDTFRGEARFGTWLGRIVINEALARKRRARPIPGLADMTPKAAGEVIAFPNASFELDPETVVARREIQRLLERAIDELPEAFRLVLIARLIEGLSVEETADLLCVPSETVKSRLHRARRLIKARMARHLGEAIGDAFPFAGKRCERVTAEVLRRLGLK